jgi:hypothetical protein
VLSIAVARYLLLGALDRCGSFLLLGALGHCDSFLLVGALLAALLAVPRWFSRSLWLVPGRRCSRIGTTYCA